MIFLHVKKVIRYMTACSGSWGNVRLGWSKIGNFRIDLCAETVICNSLQQLRGIILVTDIFQTV